MPLLPASPRLARAGLLAGLVPALMLGPAAFAGTDPASPAKVVAPPGTPGQRFLDTHLTKSTFAHPGATDQVWVRWTLSDAMTDTELRAELTQMKAANISGAEIGQGVYPTTHQLEVIYGQANQLGITISLSHGPVAGEGFSINDDNARKKLGYGSAYVEGGASFTGALPAPTLPAGATRATLVAVQAYACTADCESTATATLDPTSRVDLTDQVTGENHDGVEGGTTSGSLSWQAPAGARWAVIAFWSTPYLAQPDLLTTTGTKVLTDGMDKAFTPIKSLMVANGGDLFYDSHSADRGSPIDSWSNTMTGDFKARTGYGIEDYLPLIPTRTASGFGAPPPAFQFDAATSKRFRNDFNEARTDIWIHHQVVPLQKWARAYNQHVRVQPYGENSAAVDAITGAAYTDKTETETLWFGDEVDQYLPEAGANHMTGRNWYSIEGSASLNNAYAMTWQDQVTHMNKAYAGGVTKLVYHIYPYRSSSTSTWPGYSLFPNSFANSWGPRLPQWKDAAKYNAYFARNQQVLSQGQAKTDVAVYMQNYVYGQPYTQNNLQYWSDPSLERAGYTRDYVNPTLLDLPNATVTGKRLATHGPGYRALVLDSAQLPTSAPSRDSLPLRTARRILSYAKAGLPVIIVGDAPQTAPGLDAGESAQVRAVVNRLLRLKTTHRVASEAAVPQQLRALGISPAAKPATRGPLLSVHRHDADTDFYWLYNQGSVISPSEPATLYEPAAGEPVDTRVTLRGRGTPYSLDTWTGKITPIRDYTSDGKSITVRVKLAREDTTVVALTRNPARLGVTASRVHVVSTTADQVLSQGGRVRIAASRPGVYRTKLSNGRVVRTRIGASAAPRDLTKSTWDLQARDWQPAHPGTTGPEGAETTRKPISVTLPALTSWPNIPALTDASGTGTYTTSFRLPASWKPSRGATLSLGEVLDSFTVRVNGRAVPFADQLSTTTDVGRYLHAGRNTLRVRVTTTLRNRLRTLDPVIGARAKQEYGLIGPVSVNPYATAPVAGTR